MNRRKAAARKPARSRLRVYQLELDGLHDWIIAAPNQRAALARFGIRQDLFARGMAREIREGPELEAALALACTPLRRPKGEAGGFEPAPEPARTARTRRPASRHVAPPRPFRPLRPSARPLVDAASARAPRPADAIERVRASPDPADTAATRKAERRIAQLQKAHAATRRALCAQLRAVRRRIQTHERAYEGDLARAQAALSAATPDAG